MDKFIYGDSSVLFVDTMEQKTVTKKTKKRDIVHDLPYELRLLNQAIHESKISEASDKLVGLVKEFFSQVFSISYQFDFDDFYRIIHLKVLDDQLKKQISVFLKDVSSIWYNPYTPKDRLLTLVEEFKKITALVLKNYYSKAKKNGPSNEKKKDEIGLFKRIFLSKKTIERLRREKIVIKRINFVVDSMVTSIRSGNPKINNPVINYIYALYSSLPKNRRGKVDRKINSLFKEIKLMDKKMAGKGLSSVLAKTLPMLKMKKAGPSGGPKTIPDSSFINDMSFGNYSSLPPHYIERAMSYVGRMFDKGFEEVDIRDKLLSVGWPEEVVEGIVNDYIIKK